MKAATRLKLESAIDWCDENDKSTAFMIQYLQDVSGMTFDQVIIYLKSIMNEKRRVK